MSVGLALGKADIDNKAGSLAIQLRETLRQCAAFCDLLNNTQVIANDAALTAMGYSAGQVTTLRAAFTDAKALSNVANGLATQATTNNFFFNLQKLTGAVV